MSLWPIHPQPYSDELLSSWLVRIAHANGLKVQTFCHLEFDQRFEVWNRDIDRLAPDWLLQRIQAKTGLSRKRILNTTLLAYQGKLYDRYRAAGQLPWITTLQIYHRKRRGHGLQFCPQCLAEDDEPYFRKSWRTALHTLCPKHMNLMHDHCPACDESIAFYRQELGKPKEHQFNPLSTCWQCQFDLSKADVQKVDVWDRQLFSDWRNVLRNFLDEPIPFDQEMRDQLKITHHFMKVLFSPRLAPKLHAYLCAQTGQTLQKIESSETRISWESYKVAERHHALGLCLWLMSDYPNRLLNAWADKAIRYNHMLKDFNDGPKRFIELIHVLNRNVDKKLYKR
ncbi:hypothetical protein GCM10009007_08920 [Formosimonas limnophila]|uniref:TniQ domain-containing protein n=1 Tax=Formosimonas limnophila TaxID=1384487 RepID=A0A8J3CH12_9BURK|nr:TniQ family protein [Formosimonas limnophila]GHA70397.1 hypothetical protein GCM10009007_08920 [Formosimonas limnophila]